MIEKPPIGGKELLPLTSVQLAGFRLHPGPVRYFFYTLKYINLIIIIYKVFSKINDVYVNCTKLYNIIFLAAGTV